MYINMYVMLNALLFFTMASWQHVHLGICYVS